MQRRVAQALCRRAPLPLARACRGRPVGRVPRLPAGHHGVEGARRLHADRSQADDRFPALRPDARSGRRCKGPQAAGGGRRRGPRRRARTGRGRAVTAKAAANCSAAPAPASLGEQLIADPDLLTRKADLWLPVSSKADVAAKNDGDPAIEKLVAKADAKARSTRFNPGFLTASDATDPSVGRRLGRAQGQLPDDHGDDGCSPSRSACWRRSISRNSRRGTAGPT